MADRESHKERRGLAVVLLALIALLISAITAAGADRLYRDPKFGWSLTVPDQWTIYDKNPANVVFMAPAPAHILLMVHVATVKSDTLPALVDFMVDFRTNLFARQHLPYEIVNRTRGTLDDGTPFAELEERIGAGGPGSPGYARLRIFLVGHTALALDAESYEREWPAVAGTVATVIASFRPAPPALAPAPVN